MNRIAATTACFIGFSLLSTIAYADAIDPYAYACQGKDAGDPCTVPLNCGGNCADEHGACLDTTCSRTDYQHWDRDASPTPPIEYYDCLVCNTDGGAAWFPDAAPDARRPEPPSGSDGGSSRHEAGMPVDEAGLPGDLASGSGSDSNRSTAAGDNAGGGSNGGCTVGRINPENMIAAWIVACVVPLALTRVRRKRQ
jgi:hypothetical protein